MDYEDFLFSFLVCHCCCDVHHTMPCVIATPPLLVYMKHVKPSDTLCHLCDFVYMALLHMLHSHSKGLCLTCMMKLIGLLFHG